MYYKLWNKLFGRDYVYWENTCDSDVARVMMSGDGVTAYYLRYGRYAIKIKDKDSVVWLTCTPSKYGFS